MNPQQQINEALVRLCIASDYDFDAPAPKGGQGPFGHLQRALQELDHDLVIDQLPAFRGSWLHVLSCQVQEAPYEGQAIIAGVLPPAPMLAGKPGLSAADREVLQRGATVSIHPPDNNLLVLSPATAEAAVYATSDAGLVKLGDSVADFVEREVARLTGAAAPAAKPSGGLPAFGLEAGPSNHAVVVAGRRLAEPESQAQVRALRQAVAELGQRSGLPLAYVHMGTAINWVEGDEDTYEPAEAIIGLVTAWLDGDGGNREPIELPREALDVAALSRIPAELWTLLEDEHGLTLEDPGVYLAPAGWTVASIYAADSAQWEGSYVEGEPLVTTCAEDGEPGVRLDGHPAFAATRSGLLLYATYA